MQQGEILMIVRQKHASCANAYIKVHRICALTCSQLHVP